MAGETVLVVDDNAMNMKLVRFVLARAGYDVKEARDAEEAIQSVSDSVPHVILMDIQLPGMDGLGLTRLLRRDDRMRNVPIIALTAFAMNGDEERAIAAGCNAYVTKPIDTRGLPALVERLVARIGS